MRLFDVGGGQRLGSTGLDPLGKRAGDRTDQLWVQIETMKKEMYHPMGYANPIV